MKKYIASLQIIITVALLASCNDLDLFPQDKLGPETFWKTEDHIKQGLAGAYSKLKSASSSQYSYFDWHLPWLDAITDNAIDLSTAASSSAWMVQRGDLTPDIGGIIDNLYASSYIGIAACNNFLENLPQAAINAGITSAKANEYEGEIRFLRALFYSNLAIFYGDVPLYRKIPATVDDAKVKQSPVDLVFSLINEDLDFAIASLPNVRYSSNTGHACKASAQALKARVALFNNDYNTVKMLASQIIADGKHSLSTGNDPYNGIFTHSGSGGTQLTNPEILFSTTYLKPNYIHQADKYAGYDLTYYAGALVQPLKDLIDCYSSNDKRLLLWYAYPDPATKQFTVNGITVTSNSNLVAGWKFMKFQDKNDAAMLNATTGQQSDQDAVLLRYADVYLMYIEAMVETGGGTTSDANAVAYMKEIRSRAGLSTTNLTSVTREELRLERRKELAFEGLRYYDMKRWKILEKLNGFIAYPGLAPFVFKNNFYNWPFPQTEMEVNPNLDQKAGY
ncbi:MAG: RagB/SusD family nutrient uptake outer membrane protein [Mangrovibacterium sp.]